MATNKLDKFWAEMQPLTLVASKEEAAAPVPATLDVILRHSDGQAPDADLLREAVSELSAAWLVGWDGDTEECTFFEASEAAFDESMV